MRDALRKLKANEVLSSSATPTIAKFSKEWLASLRLEHSTIHGYDKILRNHVIPYLGDIRVDKLTATRLARHYNELLDHGRNDAKDPGGPLSLNTVNKVHVVIGALLDAAIDANHLTHNEARKKRIVNAPTGKQIRAAKPESEIWNREELNAFLAWDRDVYQDDLFALWRCLAFTGVRRSDAIALKWADLNFETRQIQFRRAAEPVLPKATKVPKTGKGRLLDIDSETMAILKEWKTTRAKLGPDFVQRDSFVFGTIDNQLRSPNSVTGRWTRAVKKARIALGEDIMRRVTIKELRHSHATILFELGIHPKIVQERMGHSNISTTMNIYSHVTPTVQRGAIDQLSEHFETP